MSLKMGRRRIVKFLEDLEKITDAKIKDIIVVQVCSNGELVGKVKLPGDWWVPFKGYKIFKKIGGKIVMYTGLVTAKSDGTLIGSVVISERRYLPFIGEKLFDECEGVKAKDFSGDSLLDGILAGVLVLTDGRSVVFLEGKFLKKIRGEDILSVGNTRLYSDGTFAGDTLLSSGKRVRFFWDGINLKTVDL